MGAKGSRSPSPPGAGAGAQPSESSSSSRPTPYIEAPYAGPWAEYQFVDVTVPVESDVTFSFSDVTMTSTHCRSALPALSGVYSQGYSLVTFCRVPTGGGSSQQKKAFSPGREVHYQGIFCRYEGDPGNEGWNLCVEKSVLHTQHVTPGVVATETGPGAQHVQRLISNTVQTGGRLLTLQWSGQAQQSNAEAALGVDVFFEVPDTPLPERSVYQLVTAPATLVRRSFFHTKGHVTGDWAAILARHLSRGWRLVDIFCEAPGSGLSSALSPTHVKIQTVWFFEKPEARARAESAAYEGTIVEHWVEPASSYSASSSLLSGGTAGCLGGAHKSKKGGGGGNGGGGKKNAARKTSILKKKADDDDDAGGQGDVTKAADDVKGEKPCDDSNDAGGGGGAECSAAKAESSFVNAEAKEEHKNHYLHGPQQTIPLHAGGSSDTAGWEGMIRSMGEKGWELATIVNTMESHTTSGRAKVKILLVFQRRISLVMSVKGRRTSDGLPLRADTGASTSVMCDIPLMSGETTSHLNPSLAVRLPLSRSASRDHDDFNASNDDIPSTIGGSCSRTHSATELSVTGGRGGDGLFLGPSRGGSRRDRGEGDGRPGGRGSAGEDGSLGTGERSSHSSQHSKVTAAEVHAASATRRQGGKSDSQGREAGGAGDEQGKESAAKDGGCQGDGGSSNANAADASAGKGDRSTDGFKGQSEKSSSKDTQGQETEAVDDTEDSDDAKTPVQGSPHVGFPSVESGRIQSTETSLQTG